MLHKIANSQDQSWGLFSLNDIFKQEKTFKFKKRTDKNNEIAGSEANNSATLNLYYNYLIIPIYLIFMLP